MRIHEFTVAAILFRHPTFSLILFLSSWERFQNEGLHFADYMSGYLTLDEFLLSTVLMMAILNFNVGSVSSQSVAVTCCSGVQVLG